MKRTSVATNVFEGHLNGSVAVAVVDRDEPAAQVGHGGKFKGPNEKCLVVGERRQGDLPVVVVDLKLGSCLAVGFLFEPKIRFEPRHEAAAGGEAEGKGAEHGGKPGRKKKKILGLQDYETLEPPLRILKGT